MDGIRKGFVFSEESMRERLDCIDENVFRIKQAEVYSGRGETKKDVTDQFRGTSQRVNINHLIFPEAVKELEDWVGDGTKVSQFDLIVYTEGSRFGRHIDNYNFDDDAKKRIHSTSTILYKSDDLVGGDLILYDVFEKGNHEKIGHGDVIDIEVGETVLFYPDRWHEVTEVTQGKRICLISWLKNA